MPVAWLGGRLAASANVGPLLLAPLLFASDYTNLWPWAMAYVVSAYYSTSDLSATESGGTYRREHIWSGLPAKFFPVATLACALAVAAIMYGSSPALLPLAVIALCVFKPALIPEILAPLGLFLLARAFGAENDDLIPSALAGLFLASSLTLTSKRAEQGATEIPLPLFIVGTFFAGVTPGVLARLYKHYTGDENPVDLSLYERTYELAAAVLLVLFDKPIGKTLLGGAIFYTANLQVPLLLALVSLIIVPFYLPGVTKFFDSVNIPDFPPTRLLLLLAIPAPAFLPAIATCALVKLYPPSRSWLFVAFFLLITLFP